MPLAKCRDCDKEVGRSAEVCPHCGTRRPAARKPPGWYAKRIAAGFLLLWGFFYYRATVPETPTGPAVTTPADTCAFTRSDARLPGRVRTTTPAGGGQTTARVVMAEAWGEVAGQVQAVTVPRNAILKTCE